MPLSESNIIYKDNSFDPIYKPKNFYFYLKSKLFHQILIFLGIFVLCAQVVIPLVFFKTQNETTPYVEQSILGKASGFNNFDFDELTQQEKEKKHSANIPDFFFLTIPKLNINNAVVETNSQNLSPEEYLGHYRGSALPGEPGNSFIYGHSVLPVFYNPKNYKTIFSTLGSLKPGDLIQIKYNNNSLTYKVEGVLTLSPSEVHPTSNIKPAYLNQSTISLMTCWPAGTKTKRLVVNAVLQI